MQGSPVSASSGRQLHELYQLPTPFPQLCSFRGFPNFWPKPTFPALVLSPQPQSQPRAFSGIPGRNKTARDDLP